MFLSIYLVISANLPHDAVNWDQAFFFPFSVRQKNNLEPNRKLMTQFPLTKLRR